MKEFLSDINSIFSDEKDRLKKIIFLSLIVLLVILPLAYYVNIIWDSIERLSFIKHRQNYYESEIKRLQQKNAQLQKEYFELKNLEPEK